MHYKTFFKYFLSTLVVILLLASCDKDFNEIGADVIGDDHLGFELYSDATVNAFCQATGSVQSNNLALNSLGIYNNPVFGKTKAGFVTQVQMASPDPKFNPDYFVSMDSVVLTVPYFSHVTASDSNGSTYALDSIYGSGSINLKVFESGYYLSDLDPSTNFEDSQKYFTSQESVFNSNKIGSPLNNSSQTIENTEFVPSAKQFVVYKRDNVLKPTTTVEKRLSPRMSLHLNKDYFYSKIFKAPAGKLMNNSVFKEYFKGIYFQVADADSGTSMKLDFTKGDITLYYTEYDNLVDADNNPNTPRTPVTFDHDDDPKTPEIPKKVIKSYVLNLLGNTVNLLEQTNNSNYANAIAPRPMPPIPNDSKLFVKGGADGSAAIIDLFGPDSDNNGMADELEAIRKNHWLINEANLTFYIDKTSMASAPEPQRIFLFDVNNRRPLYDYTTDVSVDANPKLNKSVLSGLLVKEATGGRGLKYKVRLTNHIRNLVKYADSTNVRIGLVVSESINLVGNSKLQNPVNIPYPFPSKNARALDRIPSASVMNPLGTILYGSAHDPSIPEEKRLKLEIYYTKPKN